MEKLSGVIITYNEEHNIERCINSLKKVADEVIVLDSYSTDRTAEIAENLGAVIYKQKFRGYIAQKNMALQFASYNYVLSLDADEVLDAELVNSILEVKKNFSERAYKMNRRTNFCGYFIHHGLWYPDRKLRLFDKRIAAWGGLNPHDKIQLNNKMPVVHLKGNILHYSFNTMEDLVWQNNRLSSMAATALYALGKKSSWYKMLVHPAWAFLNGYILRLGFLDGFNGFTIAIHTSHYVFLKYSKLYRLQNSKQKEVKPLSRPYIAESKSAAGEIFK
jgi:glycosyltransferase involved in cell wall biosynthesis